MRLMTHRKRVSTRNLLKVTTIDLVNSPDGGGCHLERAVTISGSSIEHHSQIFNSEEEARKAFRENKIRWERVIRSTKLEVRS